MKNNNQNIDSNSEPSELMLRYLEGDLTAVEKQQFELTDEFLEYQSILESVDNIDIPTIDESELFSKIEQRITSSKKEKTKMFSLWRVASAAAAILAIVLVVTFVLPSGVDLDTKDAIQMSHVLPDGSNIILNTDSQLKYDNGFEEDRMLSLEGEAFFEVEKGKTFTVETSLGNVSVLGTSFNVFARDGIFTVGCKTGKVSVSALGKVVVLTPGERVRFADGIAGAKEKIDLQKINSWTSGETYFESSPLIDVVTALSAKYDTDISLPSEYRNKIYTGSFVHNDIEKALKMVLLPMGVPYKLLEDGSVTIE